MTEIQEQIVEAIAGTKTPVANAVSTVVDFVVDYVPTVPALPFAEQIPTPKDIIDNQAKFASKLVTTNKTVALAAAKGLFGVQRGVTVASRSQSGAPQ